MRLIFQTRIQWKPLSMVSVQMCPLNSLNSIGICSLAQKIKLVKEWNDTSNHQLKMKYSYGAVKPSKHMLLGMGFNTGSHMPDVLSEIQQMSQMGKMTMMIMMKITTI